MKNLLFDFRVDNDTKTITVKKEFNASRNIVWDFWTKSELLDQWWAPLPYKNETITMDFSEGGKWHYAMIGPEGDKHYCKAYYKTITPQNKFSYEDAFCNELGQDLTEMPSMHWENSFINHENTTLVNCVLTFDTYEALENIIKMGFKEGFTMGLNQLETLLEQL